MFLVAHFHNVMVSAVLFGAFAGYTYWFPKAFGFQLDEWWGKAAFWFGITGFVIVFGAFYWLGLLGMTRRMQHYDVANWRPWILVSAFGVAVMLAGVVCQVVQLVVSIRRRESLRDITGDPWDGRSLEWATASPPPVFNFAALPEVHGEEAYWAIKSRAREQMRLREEPAYEPIEMPLNSPTGFICAFFSTLIGFAMIWYIWWLAAAGFLGAFVTFVAFAWRDTVEYEIPASEVAKVNRANRSTRLEALHGAGQRRAS
jgi:cytochrome o ubiquinol oxidase subunit I